VALVAVLVAVAGGDLIHHALADGHKHSGEDICFAVVAGVGLAAVTVVAARLILPRPSFRTVLGSASTWLPPAPPPTARAGPTSIVVLRL
jgi:hypothetical protein